MAPSTTLISTLIPLSAHAEGTQAAVSRWLGLVAGSLQGAARQPGDDPAGQARARILRQAAVTMLAPVEPGTRALPDLPR